MDSAKLNEALNLISQKIGGDWILLGGSLIRFDVDPARGTHDLDIVPLNPLNPTEQKNLFLEMKAIGLSPEQINSAAAFFLNQFLNWKKHLVLLRETKASKIYRPNLTLFAALKLKRGTHIDESDVRSATQKWGAKEFDSVLFLSWTDAALLKRATELIFQTA